MRVHTSVWSLELAPGWRLEDHCDYAVILNDDPDTVLRLTTLEVANGLTAAGWVERVASVQRAKGRTVAEARCGDFRGIRCEFAVMDRIAPPRREDRWVRVWTLVCDGTPLDITYSSPLWCAGRDDRDVRTMVESLQAGPRIRRGF